MSLSGSAGSVTVATTAYMIAISNAVPANDTLTVNLSNGDDLSASGLANSSVVLTLNGGNDEDVLVASSGADTVNCDAGTDMPTAARGSTACRAARRPSTSPRTFQPTARRFILRSHERRRATARLPAPGRKEKVTGAVGMTAGI